MTTREFAARAASVVAVVFLVGVLSATIAGAMASTAPQTSGQGPARVAVAAPSPSPTLGSTGQSNPDQPGAGNSSPNDYSGAVLIVLGVVAAVLVIGGGTLLFFRGRRREDLRP
jgi:hypothetical protein